MKQEYDDSYHSTCSCLTSLLKSQVLNGAIFPNGFFKGPPTPRKDLDIPPYTGLLMIATLSFLTYSPTQTQGAFPPPSPTSVYISPPVLDRELSPHHSPIKTTSLSHHKTLSSCTTFHAKYPEFPMHSCVHSCLKHVSHPCPVPLAHYTPVSPHVSNPHPSSVTNMVFTN